MSHPIRRLTQVFATTALFLSTGVLGVVWVTQSDGERVPLSIVHRKDVALDGTAPALLYGYGVLRDLDRRRRSASSRLSLLDRGFVVRHRARARRRRARPRRGTKAAGSSTR